jgi:hypothetical protein
MIRKPDGLPEPINTNQDAKISSDNTNSDSTNSDEYTATVETYDDHINTLMYNAIDVYRSNPETEIEDDFKKATCTVITDSPWIQTPIKTINASETNPDNPEYTLSWSEVISDNADWNTAIQEATHICIFNDVMKKLHE